MQVPMKKNVALATLLLTASSVNAQDTLSDDIPSLLNLGRVDSEMIRQFNREENKKQRIIAKCMKDKGFEYTPVTINLGVGNSNPQVERLTERRRGDNEIYLNALSQDRKDAYYLALYNQTIEQIEAEAPNPNYEQPGEGGCTGEAERAIEGVFETQNRYRDDIVAAYVNAEQSEEMIQLQASWSACMSSKGHAFETPSDIDRTRDDLFLEQLQNAQGNGSIASAELDPKHLKDAIRDSRQCMNQVGYSDKSATIRNEAVNKRLGSKRSEIKSARRKAQQQDLR